MPARPSEFPPASLELKPGRAKAVAYAETRLLPLEHASTLDARASQIRTARRAVRPGPVVDAAAKALEEGARIKIATRRMWLSFSQAYPLSKTFTRVPASLQDHPAWNPSGWPEGSCSHNIRFQARPAGRCTSTQDYQRPSGLPSPQKIVLHFFWTLIDRGNRRGCVVVTGLIPGTYPSK